MTAPAKHPGWCALQHGDDIPVHDAQVGATIDLTSSLSLGVFVHQVYEQPPTLLLFRRSGVESTLTGLSLLEAAILRDLISEGLGLIAREVGR
ncbi:hypothetical protein ABZS66_37295 [Dactylosporangium sp. NPDC005572]|uniref:hypothetical protein n=1 Tax=Dactylosporangium sp. NPDC005572 TaxID=3156889 RepID=UPI00339EE3E3